MSQKIKKNTLMVLGNQTLDSYKEHSSSDYILRLIWREHRISRADIARKLGLSRSTVTDLVKDLLETEFIDEAGSGVSTGGRNPVVLQFNDDCKFIIGVDIGSSHVAVAIMNLRGKLLAWQEKKHAVVNDPQGTWNLVLELYKNCIDESELDSDKLLCMGVSFPSPIDKNHPEFLSKGIIPGWEGHSGIEKFKNYFGVPVHVDNDANLCALAEHWWGVGRGVDDLIYIILGSGIGAGFIQNGHLYRGGKGIAGEISHMTVDLNGRLCGCGLKGCLTTYLATWALEKKAQSIKYKFPGSIITSVSPTIEELESASMQGDEFALTIIKEATKYLSIAISTLVNIMNPKLIVLGGSLTSFGECLFEPINESLKNTNLVRFVEPANVVSGSLKDKAAAIGAATMALDNIFSEPDLKQKSNQV